MDIVVFHFKIYKGRIERRWERALGEVICTFGPGATGD
jgi:hypothetical protein